MIHCREQCKGGWIYRANINQSYCHPDWSHLRTSVFNDITEIPTFHPTGKFLIHFRCVIVIPFGLMIGSLLKRWWVIVSASERPRYYASPSWHSWTLFTQEYLYKFIVFEWWYWKVFHIDDFVRGSFGWSRGGGTSITLCCRSNAQNFVQNLSTVWNMACVTAVSRSSTF